MGGSGFNLRSVKVQAFRQLAALFPEASQREQVWRRGRGWSARTKRWAKERKKRAKCERIRYFSTNAMKTHSVGNINVVY